MLYGLNITTGEKFEERLAWLLDQINDERINDGEEYWYFSRRLRDLAWDELKDDGFFESEDYGEPACHICRENTDEPYAVDKYCENCDMGLCEWCYNDESHTCLTGEVTNITNVGNEVYVTIRLSDGREQILLGSMEDVMLNDYVNHRGKTIKFETDWERGEYDPTADVVDITADPIRNRVYVTVRFYTKGGLSSHDIIYTGDLKQSGATDLVLDSESYTNPITGQPNFVLISEHIRDGEYERYEYFVIDAESEAKMSDKEILEWQYGEGSVDESGYGDNEFWVHGERLHEIEAQPISLSDALVLERLRIASRNYPYQDLKKE